MAKYQIANKNSVEGNFFVDTRCIGCNTCVNLAPDIFTLKDNLSYIKQQPQNKAQQYQAILALLSCPVFSIGMKKEKLQIKEIANTLPLQLENGVYYCSFNSEKSYGANSYFIKREKGNILVDSPRFNAKLIRNIEKMGGLAYIYLTHQDDIADYEKFQKHFGARVIYHEDDFNDKITSADITLKTNAVYELDEDIKIIPQSGHTKGHTVLLYQDYYLFSGDDLAYNPEQKYLYAFKNYCWYDWDTQLNSLERLLDFEFSYLLPGHGGGIKGDGQTMHTMLQECLDYNHKEKGK